MTRLHYENSGDNYLIKDPFKILALEAAAKTKSNLKRFSKFGLKKYTNSSDRDMYDSYNMGVGFALYAPSSSINTILKEASKAGISATHAGRVTQGPRGIKIQPLGLEFKSKSLTIR